MRILAPGRTGRVGWWRGRVVVAGALLAGSGWAATARADDLLDSLARMRAQYESIESVHLLASANIFLANDPEGTEALGKGSFEYWAQADRYRMDCRTPPRLGLAPDVDVAFDGQLLQLLLREMNTLSIRSGDARQQPVALPNPLFLPLDFVSPRGPDCDGCALRLTDLQTLELWDERVRQARPEVLAAPGQGGRRSLSIPGGMVDGEPTRYRLSVEGGGRAARLRRIDRLDAAGRLLATVEMDGFRTVRGAAIDFPHEIRVKVLAPGSEESAMELEYHVETLEVNVALPDEVFTLEPGEGVRVWDSDAHRFLDPAPETGVLGGDAP